MKWLDGIIDAMDMNLGKLQEIHHDQGGRYCNDIVMQSWFNIQYTITVFYYINRPDKENHTYNLEYMQRKHLTKLKIHS